VTFAIQCPGLHRETDLQGRGEPVAQPRVRSEDVRGQLAKPVL
jgi:hypothetical protein